jgi:hypothetical protein
MREIVRYEPIVAFIGLLTAKNIGFDSSLGFFHVLVARRLSQTGVFDAMIH